MITNTSAFKKKAVLTFLPNDFHIKQPGDHVICAVTGTPVDIAELRYWNVELQEAYASPEVALKRYLELRST